jgi:ATP synthase subunit 6
MICDLFSSIDGIQSFWSWGVSIILLFLFIINSRWINFFIVFVNININSLWGKNTYGPLKLFILSSLIYFIILNNLIGLSPYTFGVTSNLWFNSSLALIIWLTLLSSGWIKSPQKSIAHLAPSGAPLLLIPFLILIESVRIIIRPLTLTVRLVANIRAGHIVLALIANLLTIINLIPQSLILILVIGYVLFEFFVRFIQAYIFILLISLYATEHPS